MRGLLFALPDLQPQAERWWEVTIHGSSFDEDHRMIDAPEIIMHIQDRFTTVFTCTDASCEWKITATGIPVSAERAALEHLRVSHSESWNGGVR
jgi:hypothetical protein